MFGYLTIDRGELKGKDFDKYQRYYCGICQDLKRNSGQMARLTLTYDMTFLSILLTGLYEGTISAQEHFCILHPTKKKQCLNNRYTAYVADMNVLMVYHNLMDDWIDEKKFLHLCEAKAIQRAYKKTASKYPRQEKAIQDYLEVLHQAEQEHNQDIDLAAGLTGKMMQEIFVCEEDIWSRDLREIGFFIGKLIYLMDAFDDVEKDQKTNNYNPLIQMADEEDFENKVQGILMMMAAGAAKAFERLPVLENADILRNILYSGIWVRYHQIIEDKKKRENKRNGIDARSI